MGITPPFRPPIKPKRACNAPSGKGRGGVADVKNARGRCESAHAAPPRLLFNFFSNPSPPRGGGLKGIVLRVIGAEGAGKKHPFEVRGEVPEARGVGGPRRLEGVDVFLLPPSAFQKKPASPACIPHRKAHQNQFTENLKS